MLVHLLADQHFFDNAGGLADDDFLRRLGELDHLLALQPQIGVGNGPIDGLARHADMLFTKAHRLFDRDFDDPAIDADAAGINGVLPDLHLFLDDGDGDDLPGLGCDRQRLRAHIVFDNGLVDLSGFVPA